MPNRHPLTFDDLRRIQERYRPEKMTEDCDLSAVAVWRDILALLLEIKRMRATVLRVYHLRTGVPPPHDSSKELWTEVMQQLEVEPCIVERKAWVNDLLYPDGHAPVSGERRRDRSER